MFGNFKLTDLSNMANAITGDNNANPSHPLQSPPPHPLASTPSSNNATPEQRPEDIPREELMHLCMKLNTRMKTMEGKMKEVTKKKSTLQVERQKLLSLLEQTMKTSFQATPEVDLDLTVIEKKWSSWEEQHRLQLSDLQLQLTSLQQAHQQVLHQQQQHTQQSITASRSLDEKEGSSVNRSQSADHPLLVTPGLQPESSAASDTNTQQQLTQQVQELQAKQTRLLQEIERYKGMETFFKEQLRSSEQAIIEKNNFIDHQQKEYETKRLNLEERVVYLQLQFDTLQTKYKQISNQQEEKDILCESNKEMIIALQSRLLEIEPGYISQREKIEELERHHNSLKILKLEQDTLLHSLQQDLKRVLEEKDLLQQQYQLLESDKFKSEKQNVKIQQLQEEIALLKSENEEKTAMITRLHNDAQVAERNHAMRIAMLATMEQQMLSMTQEIQDKSEKLQSHQEEHASLQQQVKTLETRLSERVAEYETQVQGLQQELQETKVGFEQRISNLQKAHGEELEQQKRDFQKKSLLARQLLSEREEEVRQLSKKINELTEEIQSGAPTDRKIFELAQLQSKRDAFLDLHKDHREIAFTQLQATLANKDLELAQVQQRVSELYHEVIELRKVKQREGINMDYLKNVVFQYMTFPANSSEKLALVPVIAMLLQFNGKEMMEVQMSMKDPTYGMKAVKEVKKLDFSSFLSLGGGTSAAANSPMRPIVVPSSNSAKSPFNSPVPTSHSKNNTPVPIASSPLPPSSNKDIVPVDISSGSGSYKPPTIPISFIGKAEGIAILTQEQREELDKSPVSQMNGLRKDGLSMSDQEFQQKLKKLGGDILDISMSGDDHDILSLVSPKSSVDEGGIVIGGTTGVVSSTL